jgi:hypothetical protein
VLLEGEVKRLQVAIRAVAALQHGELAGGCVAAVPRPADVEGGMRGILEALSIRVHGWKQTLPGWGRKAAAPKIAGSRWTREHTNSVFA